MHNNFAFLIVILIFARLPLLSIIDNGRRKINLFLLNRLNREILTSRASDSLRFLLPRLLSLRFWRTSARYGIPIKSLSANFTPALVSLSSYNTSTPRLVNPQIWSASFSTPLRANKWTLNGATLSGQIIPLSSWNFSTITPISRDVPIP